MLAINNAQCTQPYCVHGHNCLPTPPGQVNKLTADELLTSNQIVHGKGRVAGKDRRWEDSFITELNKSVVTLNFMNPIRYHSKTNANMGTLGVPPPSLDGSAHEGAHTVDDYLCESELYDTEKPVWTPEDGLQQSKIVQHEAKVHIYNPQNNPFHASARMRSVKPGFATIAPSGLMSTRKEA